MKHAPQVYSKHQHFSNTVLTNVRSLENTVWHIITMNSRLPPSVTDNEKLLTIISYLNYNYHPAVCLGKPVKL